MLGWTHINTGIFHGIKSTRQLAHTFKSSANQCSGLWRRSYFLFLYFALNQLVLSYPPSNFFSTRKA